MSSSKATINLPKAIGGTNLTDAFGKINLSAEVREFLAALGARLVVSYSSGSEKPELEILDRAGKMVCSIDEFTKLGGFRRWVNDELKALEKEQASDKKVKLVALFFRKAHEKKFTLGERIDEGNETKFRQFHSMVEIVNHHLEQIENTISSDAREYLLAHGIRLVNVLYKLMLDCLKAEKLQKEVLDEELFKCMIPKWVFSKLVDKQFTSNLKADATSLVFPKGNYLKSISFSTRELQNEGFLAGNEKIVKHSGAIIALAKQDWSFLFPQVPKELELEVSEYLGDYQWTLIGPYNADEILDIRVGGKNPPAFKARQKPNPKPGSKARPETEVQRICREIYNTLGVITATFLHFQNFVIPVAQPLEEFWSKIISGTDAWEITPTHGLYQHLKESDGSKLVTIKDLSNESLLSLIGEVICQNIKVSTSSGSGKAIVALVKGMKDKSLYKRFVEPFTIDDNIYDVSVPTMEKVELPESILTGTKKFLGYSSFQKEKKKKRTGQIAVRLHTSVLNELEAIAGTNVYGPAKEWIANSFKTGNRIQTQLVAAQRIVGEVLKFQDQLFDEEFDEYKILEEIEEYGEED